MQRIAAGQQHPELPSRGCAVATLDRGIAQEIMVSFTAIAGYTAWPFRTAEWLPMEHNQQPAPRHTVEDLLETEAALMPISPGVDS